MNQAKGDQAKWHLQTIFLYYASFGDRNNFKLLKQQNYRRFLIDSQTVTSEDQFPYYDILFRKIDRNAVAFPQFLEMIPNMGGKFTYIQNWYISRRILPGKLPLKSISFTKQNHCTTTSSRKVTLGRMFSFLLQSKPNPRIHICWKKFQLSGRFTRIMFLLLQCIRSFQWIPLKSFSFSLRISNFHPSQSIVQSHMLFSFSF